MLHPAATLRHLGELSDDTAVIQHAVHDIPNRSTGYCTDDVSRAFIVSVQWLRYRPGDAQGERFASLYLSFLHDAQMEDGRFHNFMSFDRKWLDEAGTQDSFGRALWSLGYGIRFAPRASWRAVCARLLERALPAVEGLEFIRSIAYAMLGLAHAQSAKPPEDVGQVLLRCGQRLMAQLEEHRRPDWDWFEDVMTYDNPRLCEALMRASVLLGNDVWREAALSALRFYCGVVVRDGVFVPIGSDGWYPCGGERAIYGQQPLEAVALIDAALVAAELNGEPEWRRVAEIAAGWYHGRNTLHVEMAEDGGCRDGIDAAGVNPNMGAESTLAFLSSALTMASARQTRANVEE